MGTPIIDYEECEKFNINILLRRYWGGTKKGVCYQITEKEENKYVNLTDRELWYLIYKRIKQEFDEIQEKDTLYDGHIRYIESSRQLISYLEKRYGFGD